jgi:hypothetical protein
MIVMADACTTPRHLPWCRHDGAGDVFRGAFIYGLLRGDDPPALLARQRRCRQRTPRRDERCPWLGDVKRMLRTQPVQVRGSRSS